MIPFLNFTQLIYCILGIKNGDFTFESILVEIEISNNFKNQVIITLLNRLISIKLLREKYLTDILALKQCYKIHPPQNYLSLKLIRMKNLKYIFQIFFMAELIIWRLQLIPQSF
ncbi:unnamed protein product [Paramecium pentaurelia]|uniref:Uncharacterized protein n=1 Tax=Paramecium pentaurelia TaxID=43138 RepID=A0A8S1XAV6_9CILI|nr:unnamed protein product [Paramecium pentaurelia]